MPFDSGIYLENKLQDMYCIVYSISGEFVCEFFFFLYITSADDATLMI